MRSFAAKASEYAIDLPQLQGVLMRLLKMLEEAFSLSGQRVVTR